MRIFVLGCPGCGKSSLIAAIFGLTNHVDRSTSDDGVTIHSWRPVDDDCETDKNEDEKEEVEIWEWSGKQIYRGLQSFFFTGSSLFLLCLSSDEVIVAEEFIQTWMDIHCKISSPDIRIVLTQTCGKRKAPSTQSRISALVRCIKKIQKNHTGSERTVTLDSLTSLERSLSSVTQPEVPIHVIDLHQKKGIDELKMAIHSKIESKGKRNSHFVKDHSSVKKVLRDVKSCKTLLTKESNFLQNTKLSHDDKETMVFLEAKNTILRLYPLSGEPIICTDPRKLARLLVSIHVLDQPKVYQFDSRKFWGADVSKRPDPGDLVKTLEDLAKQGVLRESLIPLLWQNITEKEDDVMQLIEVLFQFGVIIQYDRDQSEDHEMVLEKFPRLQRNTSYYVTQVGLIPNKTPTLSWTPTPAADDIEITVRLSAKLEFPSGFKHYLLGSCQNVCLSQEPTYLWTWRDGVLVQYQKVTVRIDLLANTIDVRGRTIAPDHASTQEAVGAIWMFLSTPLAAIENIKRNWENLQLQRTVRAVDNSCHGPESLPGDPDRFIPVSDIFCQKKFTYLVPFQDLPKGCDYFGFVKFLAAKTKHEPIDCNRCSIFRNIQKGRNDVKSDWRRNGTSERKKITWILHKNPHNSKMTSAEGVAGLDKKHKNSHHASVNNMANEASGDLLLMDLVNGFVQEILRKGIAKYQEDLSAQKPKVKWSISAVTSFHATNMEKPEAKNGGNREVHTTADCNDEPSPYRRSKLCHIL